MSYYISFEKEGEAILFRIKPEGYENECLVLSKQERFD